MDFLTSYVDYSAGKKINIKLKTSSSIRNLISRIYFSLLHNNIS